MLDRSAQGCERVDEAGERDLGAFDALNLDKTVRGEGRHGECHRHAVVTVRVGLPSPEPATRHDQVVALGVPRVAVHKGLSGDNPFASPVDIGPAALAYPDVAFVAYHSGFEGPTEGPWTEAGRDEGANRLVSTVLDAGIAPGANVYAELGSTWRSVMGDPTSAAHLLGKLLVALGPDNILWGTDSIWYGSPQDQIAAFRTFEISPELQDRHGYPALTSDVKAKILGLNAARLYGIDPVSIPCRPSAADLEELRTALPGAVNRTYGPTSAAAAASDRSASGWFG